MDIIDARRRAVVATYARLADKGLLQLSAGNLSVRIGERMLITPTGATRDISPSDLVEMTLGGSVIGAGVPSSEWRMHAAIYADQPETGALVHAHGDACTALSCLRRPIPAFHYMIAAFGGRDVPCTAFAPFGSSELADMASTALHERTACLLANHGMICRAEGIEKAADTAAKLEMLARQYILACQAGAPVLLDDDEVDEAHRRYRYYGKSLIPSAS